MARKHHIDRRARVALDHISGGDPEELLNTHEAAAILGCSRQFLEIGRCRGYGPSYLKMSPRMVRYRRCDIAAWLKGREVVVD